MVLALQLLFLGSVNAAYISGDIYVYDDGEVRFDVDSDVELSVEGLEFDGSGERISGRTEMLTRMEAGVWTFQIMEIMMQSC